ncbi:MAG: dTMP kinase [Treponema sp.]|nr:dTMP kinase [Treponema sp.]
MKILDNFVVFEGGDGSGTTTQLGLLEDFFSRNPEQLHLPPLYKTTEPTNSSIGKLIRSFLRKETALLPQTAAMLFAADRNEHIYASGGVAERCARGELVVSDRYLPSSLVYQGLECGDALPEKLNGDFPLPQLLIFFDIEPETAQRRMAGRDMQEIYEYLDFQIKVRTRYKNLLPRFQAQGVIVEVVDAASDVQTVAQEVRRIIQKLPIMKR